MALTDQRRQQVCNAYHGLMSDIRARNDALNQLIEQATFLPINIIRESAYLQLRMMAELVALACVVAHDELTTTKLKALRGQWNAANIFAELSRHQPEFFPRAISRQSMGDVHHVEALTDRISQRELSKIWEGCGRYLHRGSVKQLGKPQPIENDPLGEVRHIQSQIIDLLNDHCIAVGAGRYLLLCHMIDATTGGVVVAVAEADPEDDHKDSLDEPGLS